MELRYLKRVGEYETVLQYRVFGEYWSEWMDVPTITENE